MAECDNDHEPIQFASPFAALCPLCALKREMAKEVDELRHQLNRIEDERDYLESNVKELQAKLGGK